MTPLAIYLRNHEAAAQAGLDLFRRATSNQRRQPHAGSLRELTSEIESDLETLRSIMRRRHIPPEPGLAAVLRIGERLARLKPNGRLITRSPLSDLIEIEAMLNAVHAKAAGWQIMIAATTDDDTDAGSFQTLLQRAVSQTERLSDLHSRAAAAVLT